MSKLQNNPPVEIGQQIKIFDFNGTLVHEGLTVAAPNTQEAYRDDGNGVWTYFFQSLKGGITVSSPHKVEFIDGTGFKVKTTTMFETTLSH